MKFDLILRNSQFQAFKCSDNTLFKKRFLYVYRKKVNEQLFDVEKYESNHLPLILITQYKGFLFIKNNVKERQLLELKPLMRDSIEIPKTLFIDLSELFKDTDDNIAYVLWGTNGRITNTLLTTTNDKSTIKRTIKKYIKEQNNGPKTAKAWFNMILEKAPMIYYNSIKNNIPEIKMSDISLLYDLRVKDEFEVIKEIENILVDKHQIITIYNDYSGLYNQIIKNKLKVKKIEDDYLLIKYKDLMNSGLTFNLLCCLN